MRDFRKLNVWLKGHRLTLDIAMGSASELEYHLLLVHDLGFLNSEGHQTLSTKVQEVKRMLSTFINKLRSSQPAREMAGRSARG